MDQIHLPDPVRDDINVLKHENSELVSRVIELENNLRMLMKDMNNKKDN